MLKWPKKALQSISTFFRPLNDIDVFVEDVGAEAFYRELLGRLVGDSYSISRVFSLGGRSAVLESCEQFVPSGRPTIFIIDGDFEWVRGVDCLKSPYLFRHDCYCVENLLICECGPIEIILESDGNMSRSEAKRNFDWRVWKRDYVVPLRKLFIIFAVASELLPTERTVDRGIGSILGQHGKKRSPKIDHAKLESIIIELKDKIITHVGIEKFSDTYERIANRVDTLSNPDDIISGKDFLLPLLRFRLKSVVKDSFPDDSFRFRLARHCAITRLEKLKNALDTIAKGDLLTHNEISESIK